MSRATIWGSFAGMSLVLSLALQAAVAPEPPAIAAIDFDLARHRPARDGRDALGRVRRCAPDEPEPIVVCGRRPDGGAWPMEEWERIFALAPLVAETRLYGNIMGDIHGESVALDRGAVSNRAVVRVRVPF